MALSKRDEHIASLLREEGLKYPRTAVQEARKVGLPISYAVAFLEKESSGRDQDGSPRFGLNLFGHDPVANPVRGGFVSEAKYREYLRHRRAGKGMQGVGPCQLTWWEFQDLADRLGGCWRPRFNMRVGFGIAKRLIREHGKREGVKRYNGTGPAAERYAEDWIAKQAQWRQTLTRASTAVRARERHPTDTDSPRIITARSLGLRFANMFGQLGPELHVTGHYSAGPRAKTAQEGIKRARSFHAQHRNQGWGGCGYHYIIPDDGALICLRPTLLKGAHVGKHNTSNIGVNMPGTVGDKPTNEQRDTYRWLLANAHTNKMPKAHRTDRDLRRAQLHGHKSWPGHESNGCPGRFLSMYLKGLT